MSPCQKENPASAVSVNLSSDLECRWDRIDCIRRPVKACRQQPKLGSPECLLPPRSLIRSRTAQGLNPVVFFVIQRTSPLNHVVTIGSFCAASSGKFSIAQSLDLTERPQNVSHDKHPWRLTAFHNNGLRPQPIHRRCSGMDACTVHRFTAPGPVRSPAPLVARGAALTPACLIAVQNVLNSRRLSSSRCFSRISSPGSGFYHPPEPGQVDGSLPCFMRCAAPLAGSMLPLVQGLPNEFSFIAKVPLTSNLD